MAHIACPIAPKLNSKINMFNQSFCHRLRKVLTIIGLLVWILFSALGCSSGSEKANPVDRTTAAVSSSSQGRICTWNVPAGQTYTFQNSPGGPASVNFIGSVYHASKDANCQRYDSLLHPLVIYAHGRYVFGTNNHLGSTYLMNHLASWGDICMSVNLDTLQMLDGANEYGIPHRSELILHAIEYMARECRTPASIFYKRIDTTRIALVGHSRGGGAVIYACNFNATHRNRPIRSVSTISPANFGTLPLQPAIPHLSLYGSWDGDLFRGQGPDIWSRGGRAADRMLVEVSGANHYYFSDAMSFSWESQAILRPAHQTIAKGFINAWQDKHLRGLNRWNNYLTGQQSFEPAVVQSISYMDDHFLVLDDGSPAGNATINNRGGTNTNVGLPLFVDFDMSVPPDYQAGPALQTRWDGGQDRLEIRFPEVDASAYTHLHFRLSTVHGDALNKLDTKKDLNVRVRDASGATATVRLSNYQGGLKYPDLSGSLRPVDEIYNRKQIPRSFRIPKTDLPGVDFAHLAGVDFVFNRPNGGTYQGNKGSIKIDDLEVTE